MTVEDRRTRLATIILQLAGNGDRDAKENTALELDFGQKLNALTDSAELGT
jgi:hypothetical protein